MGCGVNRRKIYVQGVIFERMSASDNKLFRHLSVTLVDFTKRNTDARRILCMVLTTCKETAHYLRISKMADARHGMVPTAVLCSG